MAGYKFIDRKKNISAKLNGALYNWMDFETENVEFSIIGDDGWVLLYGSPIALIKRANRNKVHSINVEVLRDCSRSRFFMQERLGVPVMKDKRGLYIKSPATYLPSPGESQKDDIVQIPDMVRWVYLGDLSRVLFSLVSEQLNAPKGHQLPLSFTFNRSKVIDWSEVVDTTIYPSSVPAGLSEYIRGYYSAGTAGSQRVTVSANAITGAINPELFRSNTVTSIGASIVSNASPRTPPRRPSVSFPDNLEGLDISNTFLDRDIPY